MIRFIVQTDDANMAANVGGSVHTSYRTFDVDLPELEKHLKTGGVYIERRLVGCELLSAADQPDAGRAYHETHELPHCPTCECGADNSPAGPA